MFGNLGIHVIKFPSGRYGFRGSIPFDLLYTEKEPLTDEMRNRISRMDERFRKTYVTENVFNSAAEAVAFAKAKGYDSYTEEP